MARREVHGRFNQPSHTPRYYHIEMECFVYNWRIARGCRLGRHPDGGRRHARVRAGAGRPVSLIGLNSSSGVLSLTGLNSVSGSIPALGNAAGAAPGVANTSGTLTGGLQNGGSISPPLSGVTCG